MRFALLQLNPIIGDLSKNTEKIVKQVQEIKQYNVDLCISSELALMGYPPRDLLYRQDFVARSWKQLKQLALRLQSSPPLLIGIAEPNSNSAAPSLFNSAALLRGGKIETCFRKRLLPSYDVFDEHRYFAAATSPQVLELNQKRLGISVCEDIYPNQRIQGQQRYNIDPITELTEIGVDTVINLSASPFSMGKGQCREQHFAELAVKHRVQIIFVNQVGANDELIFDGRSAVFTSEGRCLARAKAFAEDLLVVDLPQQRPIRLEPHPEPEEKAMWQAVVLGIRDYVHKCAFDRILLGLSGGIDSSLTAVLAVDAIGADGVLGVLMPSPYSSNHSISDARKLAGNLGIQTIMLPIQSLMQAFSDSLKSAFSDYEADETEENIQARIRGTLLMALANKYHSMLLATSNKSELAVGYCTLYGDMCGALAPISDLFKSKIYRLARWRNRDQSVIPETVLDKMPSAELRPGQTDQDSLAPYDLLDPILEAYIEHGKSLTELTEQGFDPMMAKKIIALVERAEFKRKQAVPGLKLSSTVFRIGWRMPIAKHFPLS